jgi:hypothetical protein
VSEGGTQKAAVLFVSLYFPAKKIKSKGYFLLLTGLTPLALPNIRKAVTASIGAGEEIVRCFPIYKAVATVASVAFWLRLFQRLLASSLSTV